MALGNNSPRIAIVYLSFHSEPYLRDVVTALQQLTYPKDRVEFVIVDNPHPVHGSSVRFIEEEIMPESGVTIPHVTILPQKENLGFAAGNNVGAKWAIEHGCEYVYFHNNDGFLAADALEPLVAACEGDKGIGIAQSLILLHPETDLMNSSGNIFHYLGFGYTNQYRRPIEELTAAPVQEVGYASGAGMMVSAQLVEEYGGWDADYWMYHEDIEWSFRLRSLGYKIVMVRASRFYHKYQFGRSIQKFYWMERNRIGLLLTYFKWPTLLLLFPIGLALEFGLWIFALRNGTVTERLRVLRYWVNPLHIFFWLKKRRQIQRQRTVPDRFLLSFATGGIHFQEKSMEHPLLLYVGNPVMTAYFWLVRFIVRW